MIRWRMSQLDELYDKLKDMFGKMSGVKGEMGKLGKLEDELYCLSDLKDELGDRMEDLYR